MSVMEASAAASAAASNLASARGTLTRNQGAAPGTGCIRPGTASGRFRLQLRHQHRRHRRRARGPGICRRNLPHVVHVEDNLFTCSQDTQDKMKEVIQEKYQPGGGGLLLTAHP
jgi:hypothetical protein